ncbi:MAG: tetratricopeptide repeat protein [Hyphomonadaceae bacterium]|nr:tetratricopeptide repeat protein [Hyphomonadaceae bacterium]
MSRYLRLPATLLALSALTACATFGGDDDASASLTATRPVDRQARERIAREDLLTQMAFWAGEYQTFPNDLEAAQRFSDALRRGGRAERAAQIAGEAIARFPEDRALLNTYGLSQISAGRPQEALRPLAMVAAAQPENWRVRSALGAALDQLGRYTEARRAYQEALALHPNEPTVLTNMGVSHILAGELDQAEAVLRQASSLTNAPLEARQNLAVAIALQGRFDEAERVASVDLPPAQAAANVAYLRSLLSDPRRWDELGRQS